MQTVCKPCCDWRYSSRTMQLCHRILLATLQSILHRCISCNSALCHALWYLCNSHAFIDFAWQKKGKAIAGSAKASRGCGVWRRPKVWNDAKRLSMGKRDGVRLSLVPAFMRRSSCHLRSLPSLLVHPVSSFICDGRETELGLDHGFMDIAHGLDLGPASRFNVSALSRLLASPGYEKAASLAPVQSTIRTAFGARTTFQPRSWLPSVLRRTLTALWSRVAPIALA